MAYQNIGTPRFFIDNYMYLRALGLDTEEYINQTEDINDPSFPNSYMISPLTDENIFTLSPELGKPLHREATPEGDTPDGMRFFIPCGNLSGIDFSGNMKWYGAMLNHNLGDCDVRIQNVMFHEAVTQGAEYFIGDPEEIGVLNAGNYVHSSNVENGSSIWYSDLTPDNHPYTGFAITGDGGGSLENFQVGAISMGVMYTMPNSADLDLTMQIEFDGYDETETLGGSTLTNIRQTGSPVWSNDGKYNSTFSVGDFSNNQYLGGAKRNGRRSWSLKFSYIADSDIFSSNYMNTNHLEMMLVIITQMT